VRHDYTFALAPFVIQKAKWRERRMQTKMTWEEMKAQYPNEWLLITDFELDEYGQIICGIIERHSKLKRVAALPPIVNQDTAFFYTGESAFLGMRSHAVNHNSI